MGYEYPKVVIYYSEVLNNELMISKLLNLVRRTYFNLRYNVWNVRQLLCIILAKLHIFHDFFRAKSFSYNASFIKKWQIKEGGYFNFKGAILPNISGDNEMTSVLKECFMDTFLIPCYYNDNHNKDVIDHIDKYTREGAYGYIDKDIKFDVSIEKGDIVIDAGAWIGDFAAYAASKGAEVYAFEPTPSLLPLLKETARLNRNKITPISEGLSEKKGKMMFNDNGGAAFGNRFTNNRTKHTIQIPVTTLDSFVEEYQLSNIDFIKADIEGDERLLLQGAKKVLREFAPKLAICTYHYPDDPQVLEGLIKEANPNYTVIQKRHKLYACVIPGQDNVQ